VGESPTLSAIEFLERIANSFRLAILSWAIYKKIVNIGNQFVHALIVHFQLIVHAFLHETGDRFSSLSQSFVFSLRFLKERD